MRHTTSAGIGAEIRAHLGRQDKSASWLAAEVGIDPSGMSRRIRGDRPFSVDELTLIASALDVPLSALMPEPVAS